MTDYSALKPRAGYGAEPLASPLDAQIQELMQGIRGTGDFVRVLSELPGSASGMLDVFALRMASLAVRNANPRNLRDGLVAAQLALMANGDFRDVLMTVSLLHRAAEMIGIDPSQEFRAVASLAGDPPNNRLIEYLERSPEKKRIERMGYAEGSDDSGFRFVSLI